jgi:TrkA-N domain.
MQIIIIGAGLVGLSLSEKLCEDNDVTLIEKDEDASKKQKN